MDNPPTTCGTYYLFDMHSQSLLAMLGMARQAIRCPRLYKRYSFPLFAVKIKDVCCKVVEIFRAKLPDIKIVLTWQLGNFSATFYHLSIYTKFSRLIADLYYK